MACMDRDDKDRIHLALEKAGGNRKIAAVMLGLTMVQMKNKIYDSPELRNRWAQTSEAIPVQTVVEAASRQPPPEPREISREEALAATAQALAIEAKMMGEDMQRMNLPDDAAKVAVEMFLFNRKHFVKSLDMLAGGVGRQAIMLNHFLDGGWARLKEVRELISSTVKASDDGTPSINVLLREVLVNEERGLNSAQAEFLNVLGEYFKTGFKAGETLAMIRQALNVQEDNKPKGKPRFTEEKPNDNGTDSQAS